MPTSSELHTAFLAIAHDAEQMAKSLRNFASLYATGEDDQVATIEDDGTKKRKRRVTKLVDPRQPEKAQSAYNHFIKENYYRVREEDATDNRSVMTVLGKEWKETSDEEKKKYQAMAAKDKERFEREMKDFLAYRKEHPYDAATEGTSASSKKQKKKLANASQTSPAAEDEDELQKSSDEEEEQTAKEPKGDAAKVSKEVKKKADKKDKKAKAGSDKNEHAKDGKKKRRNSKSKKPVTKGQ